MEATPAPTPKEPVNKFGLTPSEAEQLAQFERQVAESGAVPLKIPSCTSSTTVPATFCITDRRITVHTPSKENFSIDTNKLGAVFLTRQGLNYYNELITIEEQGLPVNEDYVYSLSYRITHTLETAKIFTSSYELTQLGVPAGEDALAYYLAKAFMPEEERLERFPPVITKEEDALINLALATAYYHRAPENLYGATRLVEECMRLKGEDLSTENQVRAYLLRADIAIYQSLRDENKICAYDCQLAIQYYSQALGLAEKNSSPQDSIKLLLGYAYFLLNWSKPSEESKNKTRQFFSEVSDLCSLIRNVQIAQGYVYCKYFYNAPKLQKKGMMLLESFKPGNKGTYFIQDRFKTLLDEVFSEFNSGEETKGTECPG